MHTHLFGQKLALTLWNVGRGAQGLKDANFKDCILRNAIFHGINSPIQKTKTVLTNQDFRNCDLTNADLTDCILDGASFRNAVVSGLRLGGSSIKNVDWTGAKNPNPQNPMSMGMGPSGDLCIHKLHTLGKRPKAGSGPSKHIWAWLKAVFKSMWEEGTDGGGSDDDDDDDSDDDDSDDDTDEETDDDDEDDETSMIDKVLEGLKDASDTVDRVIEEAKKVYDQEEKNLTEKLKWDSVLKFKDVKKKIEKANKEIKKAKTKIQGEAEAEAAVAIQVATIVQVYEEFIRKQLLDLIEPVIKEVHSKMKEEIKKIEDKAKTLTGKSTFTVFDVFVQGSDYTAAAKDAMLELVMTNVQNSPNCTGRHETRRRKQDDVKPFP
jgi:hypothetical protein